MTVFGQQGSRGSCRTNEAGSCRNFPLTHAAVGSSRLKTEDVCVYDERQTLKLMFSESHLK